MLYGRGWEPRGIQVQLGLTRHDGEFVGRVETGWLFVRHRAVGVDLAFSPASVYAPAATVFPAEPGVTQLVMRECGSGEVMWRAEVTVTGAGLLPGDTLVYSWRLPDEAPLVDRVRRLVMQPAPPPLSETPAEDLVTVALWTCDASPAALEQARAVGTTKPMPEGWRQLGRVEPLVDVAEPPEDIQVFGSSAPTLRPFEVGSDPVGRRLGVPLGSSDGLELRLAGGVQGQAWVRSMQWDRLQTVVLEGWLPEGLVWQLVVALAGLLPGLSEDSVRMVVRGSFPDGARQLMMWSPTVAEVFEEARAARLVGGVSGG